MKPSALPGLLLVTDRKLCAAGLLKSVEGALEGGVRFVQLREKDLSARELLDTAVKLRALTDRYEALLTINDRADIAVVCGADGVHLGVKSLSPVDARGVLGDERLIGRSAHSLEEALRAEAEGADYITLGPVYRTPSKAAYGSPVGVGPIREAALRLKIPVFAIGGVKADNLEELKRAGAYGAAVISAILAADTKESALDFFRPEGTHKRSQP